MEKRNSQLEHGQLMEQTRGMYCMCESGMWLAVNHNTSITSGHELDIPIARASELGSCQSNFFNS